ESEPSLRILDSYAVEIGKRRRGAAGFVEAANCFLFREQGFTGNQTDYYNPLNSCLNEVLASKTGIPITLSVIYLEVARRLGAPVFGIGLPGHFLVQYDDGSCSTYIDPFHGGRLLEAADCYALAGASPDPTLLAHTGKRRILARMVNNLRGIYFSRGVHRKSLEVLNLLLDAYPNAAEEYKQRAMTYLQLERPRAAKADFERYVELSPNAPDRADVDKQTATLNRWLAGLN